MIKLDFSSELFIKSKVNKRTDLHLKFTKIDNSIILHEIVCDIDSPNELKALPFQCIVPYFASQSNIIQSEYCLLINKNYKYLDLCGLNLCDYISSIQKLHDSCCNFTQTYPITLDAHYFGCLQKEMMNSPKFSMNVFRFFSKQIEITSSLKISFLFIELNPESNYNLDLCWFKRLKALESRDLLQADILNWLSTLGGAYSALGDYNHQHAEMAGQISLQQLQLAKEMQNESLVVRCYLFLSLSIMQQGNLRLARKLILKQYIEVKKNISDSYHLLQICKGVWCKLKYMWALWRQHQQLQSTSFSFT